MNLFDASALLCFIQGEHGADVVERELLRGGRCSAANWSEVAQKILSHAKDWELTRGLLLSYGLAVEPVRADDAEGAARLWRKGSGLSLADRLCLATGHRLKATVWTADTAWGSTKSVRQVR
ncbi:MAG: type II toxin-antitoxin system VapC family toxin [Jatrophihabitantaceae bacterium]